MSRNQRITRAEVIALYLLFLGREPESESVITNYMLHASRAETFETIVASSEFATRIRDSALRDDPLVRPLLSDHATGILRRLEHLTSLGLDFAGTSVATVGAQDGFTAMYFLDRNCVVSMIGASRREMELARVYVDGVERARNVTFDDIELGDELSTVNGLYDAVYCRGHLSRVPDMDTTIDNLTRMCRNLLLLEVSCACGDGHELFANTDANRASPHSVGKFVPTRPWIAARIGRHFSHVYFTRTQANHHDFPTRWNTGTFFVGNVLIVASRTPLDNPMLTLGPPPTVYGRSS